MVITAALQAVAQFCNRDIELAGNQLTGVIKQTADIVVTVGGLGQRFFLHVLVHPAVTGQRLIDRVAAMVQIECGSHRLLHHINVMLGAVTAAVRKQVEHGFGIDPCRWIIDAVILV